MALISNKVVSVQNTYDSGGRDYDIIDTFGNKLTLKSVTTQLDVTSPPEKKQILENWRNRVGHDVAEEITKAGQDRGTLMHAKIEAYLYNKEGIEGESVEELEHSDCYDQYYDNFLAKHDLRSLLIEAPLYWYDYENKIGFAGTVDWIGYVDDRLTIIDHKSKGKWQREEWMDDSKHQIAAYWKAAETIYDIRIDNARVNIARHDGFQYITMNREDLEEYWTKYYHRMSSFYIMESYDSEVLEVPKYISTDFIRVNMNDGLSKYIYGVESIEVFSEKENI